MGALNNLTSEIIYIFTIILLIIISIGLLVALFYGITLILRSKNREEQSLAHVLLEIKMPSDNEIKIDAAEQMLSAFSSFSSDGFMKIFKTKPTISFEIVARAENIRFYISTPQKYKDMIEKQIHGAYPSAEVSEVPEQNIFSEKGKVAFAEFKLKNSTFFPIKVYKDLVTDPLSTLTSAMAKIQDEEGLSLQILISSASGKWRNQGKGYISSTKSQESNPEKAKFSVEAKTLDAVENKYSKPGFETTLRIVSTAPTIEQAKANLSNFKSTFDQFSSSLNGFKGKKIWFKKGFMMGFIYRYQPVFSPFNQRMILTSEELATIFHFPNKFVETPHINWLYSKTAPAPADIPREGLYLGKSVYRGLEKPVYISENDRRRHAYIIGKTGAGKTELMRDMIIQDIKAGKGVCLIDPHDLAESILGYIPPERVEDVIYFDPSDTDRPMGLNLLEAETEDQKHLIANSIIGLMYKLYDPYKTGMVGPRFEHGIRNAMLTVMAEKGNTFVELMRVMTDSKFVQELLPKVDDPVVRRYWTDQIAQTADFHKSEVLDYTVSKFGRFITNRTMRNIIGQSKSSFDFRKVMDEGKILIINLAKGKLGEENSNFLGLILVPRILSAAMSRVNIPEEQRKDFYLYVDEFQNFATPDFAVILSEARKYKLNLIVANQFVGQMEDEVKNAIFGNVGTIVSFNIGVTDANFLQHWFSPTFAEDDLMNIERFHAYVKTIVKNEPVPPFSIDTTKDIEAQIKESNPKTAEMIKQLSRLKYGRDRNIVEAEINERA
ncbi:MAG: type IV secretion system DNA-binding domain-containing protein, partial [Patescibacteria group bacterium]